jgi:hypothetical protein
MRIKFCRSGFCRGELLSREKFITLALTNTDERVRAGKGVSPGCLFATLPWNHAAVRNNF